MFVRIIVLTVFSFTSRAAALAPFTCQELLAPQHERQVGVETIHVTSDRIITVHLALPKENGRIVNLSSLKIGEPAPERFVISDGTLTSAFIEVDSRQGSRLEKIAQGFAELVRGEQRRSNRTSVEVLRTFIADQLAATPDDWRPGLRALQSSHFANKEFFAAKDLAAGHFPIVSELKHPVIALEWFLDQGKGACLPKVLLTSVILRQLKIPHRIAIGGSDFSGHSWIELADGRILDPTWQLLEKPSTEGALNGWFRFSQSWLFRNQFSPVAVDL